MPTQHQPKERTTLFKQRPLASKIQTDEKDMRNIIFKNRNSLNDIWKIKGTFQWKMFKFRVAKNQFIWGELEP
jgi:hypothetical protein